MKNKKTIFGVVLSVTLFVSSLHAQKLQSDNGDGTYTNPVISADFPDPDVIRVDSVYYFVSTTMFVFPGVTILKSYDLVNWEYCSNALPRFDCSPCYNLDGCNRYGHGQWATSIKYYHDKFHILFITLDEGGFYLTADKAEGPWKVKHLPKRFYDPGLFFDDDGKIYVAHGYNDIKITEVDSNLVVKSDDVIVFAGDIRKGLEGAHVYKINDYYYLYCTYGGLDGFQVALRSKNIYGPYDQKIVIRDTTHGPNYGIHQGALIHTQTGEWWTMLFVDSGPFGRFPSLQPVSWEDGWPIVGIDGKAVETYKKPDVGSEFLVKNLPTSDEFEEYKLGMQWGWNHNPDSTKWSLEENKGHLRISTVKVVDNFIEARNTLTQRMFSFYSDSTWTVGTTKLDIDNMKDGDYAGLAIFQDPYAFIGIKADRDKKYLIMVNNGKIIDSIGISTSKIYLRVDALYGSGAAPYYKGETVANSGTASFFYSLDGESYLRIGNNLQMQFSLKIFTGNKFCLFNYPTLETGGYVDFDWFHVEPFSSHN
jgi:beta-xylosidase